MSTPQSSYELQANDFLAKADTKISFRFVRHDYYLVEDKEMRDIWDITLSNPNGTRRFRFGQSLADVGKRPNAYALLACVTKGDPHSFEDFCSEYEYDTDSRNARTIYGQVRKEWDKINFLFTPEQIDELRDIS